MEGKKTKYECDVCSRTFDREDRWALYKLKNCNRITCLDCEKQFDSKRELTRHTKKQREDWLWTL